MKTIVEDVCYCYNTHTLHFLSPVKSSTSKNNIFQEIKARDREKYFSFVTVHNRNNTNINVIIFLCN